MMLVDYFIAYNRYLNVCGIFFILAIAWLLSFNRRAINMRTIISGLALQWAIGYAVLRTSIGHTIVKTAADAIGVLYMCADEGTRFIFGSLAENRGTPWGFVFAIKVLPVIIFFGAFMSILFYFKIVQTAVRIVGYVLQPLLNTSGPETVCAIANSFLGQTEAPLLIRHYLRNLNKSEMFVVMVSGMATISGAILAVFAIMGVPAIHLLSASVMAIPASLVIAKIIYPASLREQERESAELAVDEVTSSNMLDAIAQGTTDGLSLALNVGAMLVAFLGLLALVNLLLAYGSTYGNTLLEYGGASFRLPVISLQWIFGYICAPFGFFLGFKGQEMYAASALIGTKVAVNELIAYSELVTLPVSERMMSIMTYALCGFSNFSCIGIQIGGIGALVPERRPWLTELGIYAVIAGALSNLLSAMVAAILL